MHLFPPQNFGAVEDGIYRSGLPSELNYRFLESLNLKTVIVLSPESMSIQFSSFLEDFGICVVYIQNAANDGFRGLSPVAEETVIEALHVLTNRSYLVRAFYCHFSSLKK
jgi:tyrosine-protein phosphatase OCA1